MRIFINTLGSRGDVQPYVALGKGLKAAGHQVTIATSVSFKPFVTQHGLDYGYVNDGLLDLMDSPEARDAMQNMTNPIEAIRISVRMMSQSKPVLRSMLKDSYESAVQAQPDLIIYNSKAYGAVHIAEKLNVPVIMALTCPQLVPTAESPAIGFPALNLGGWYNRLSYRLVAMGFNSYSGVINELRIGQMGIGKMPRQADLLHSHRGTPIPVLHAYSPILASRPSDWPPHAHVTGFWFLERAESWQPPADLLDFLDTGSPPVYVGFGSMAGTEPVALTKLVIEALQKAEVRGIIATGWGGLSDELLPESIFRIAKAPHDWLFPRMAAVVHHGGAGTTSMGLRAGRPTVICPFFGDQPFWGKRIHSLGAGPKSIPQKKLAVDNLAHAIGAAVTDQTIQAKADELGQRIHQEDGIGKAIDLIEKVAVEEQVA